MCKIKHCDRLCYKQNTRRRKKKIETINILLRFINQENQYIPGMGGVEPPESPPLFVDSKPFITPPKFDDDEFLEEWFFELRDVFI